MSYQYRDTERVFPEDRAIGTGGFTPSINHNSSEIPPHSGIVSAVVAASQVGTVLMVEGKLADSSVWVALAYMVAAAEGTAVPGTDGVADGTVTSFYKALTLYPRTRLKAKAGTGATTINGWIQG